MNHNIFNQENIEELKEYHALEDELSCSLKVIAKAIIDSKIINSDHEVVEDIQVYCAAKYTNDTAVYKLSGTVFNKKGEDIAYREYELKDYKKTWWLI